MTGEDLRKAQRKYDKRHDIIWKFVKRSQFRLLLTMMEKGVAYSERRYLDAKKKYEDLLAPLDEIDLALSQIGAGAGRGAPAPGRAGALEMAEWP